VLCLLTCNAVITGVSGITVTCITGDIIVAAAMETWIGFAFVDIYNVNKESINHLLIIIIIAIVRHYRSASVHVQSRTVHISNFTCIHTHHSSIKYIQGVKRTGTLMIIQYGEQLFYCLAWWLICVLHPKGRRLESHSNRHGGTLGKSFTDSAFSARRVNSNTVSMLQSGAPLSSI